MQVLVCMVEPLLANFTGVFLTVCIRDWLSVLLPYAYVRLYLCGNVVSDVSKYAGGNKKRQNKKHTATMENINYQTKTFSFSFVYIVHMHLCVCVCVCMPCNFRQSSRPILLTTWVLLKRTLKAVNRQQEACALH